MRFIITAFLLTITSLATFTFAYPKATDRPNRWQLTFETSGLRFYRDQRTDQGYWVLVYEVTNETDKDLLSTRVRPARAGNGTNRRRIS